MRAAGRALRRVGVWFACLCLATAAPAAVVEADGRLWGGPLRFYDAHPMDAIFLATPTLDAVLPGAPAWDFRISHFSTLAISPNVLTTPAGGVLASNAAAGRPQQPLNTAALAISAAQRPNETFFFADTETTRLDISYLHPLSERWALAVDVPIWGHHGGVFDPVIEGFHGTFNFPDLQRSYAPDNRTQLVVARGGQMRVYDGPFEPAVGDVVVRALHQAVIESDEDPAVLLGAALKVPLGPASRFLGSGGWDWGVDVHLARAWGNWRAHLDSGVNFHDRWAGLGNVPLSHTFDIGAGLETKLTPEWSLLAALTRHEHALSAADPRTFGRAAYNIGFGFRLLDPPNGFSMEGGFFENLTEDANSYDVGIQYRLQWTR